MTASEALPKVLDRIDHDLAASLDRLFALLRIQSVSTDPAYAPHCRTAAEHVATDLRGLGFETSVRPTQGHPVVIGKSGNGKANGNGNGVGQGNGNGMQLEIWTVGADNGFQILRFEGHFQGAHQDLLDEALGNQ